MAIVQVEPARARHHWSDPTLIPASQSADGCDRNERTCRRCRLVKVTVIPPQGLPWRAWRTADGKPWQGEATPPCLPDEVAA